MILALLLAGVVAQSAAVRFHHVHYQAADPSAAMAEAVAKLGGTRTIVQGLGVGVKVGEVFVLFDRAEPAAAGRSVLDAQATAIEWLRQKGVRADAGDVGRFAFLGPHDHIAFATAAFDETVTRLGAVVHRTADRALFDANGVAVEIVRETELPDAFWCPMHPDVRSGVEGKCPLCGMALVPIPPPKIGEYKLDVAVQRTARGARGLTLTVRDPETGAVVRDFATVHEKPFHLFVVSRDLEYFAHVHPEAAKDGGFVLKHDLPPDEYMLIADFLPVGGTPQMVQRAIVVSGVRSRFFDELRSSSKNRDLTPGTPGAVRIEMEAEDVVPGKDGCLTFTVTDAKTGEPVTDLEPLLGAPAHLLMVRADLTDAIHAHPEELETRGPTISFHPLIPAPGEYKLWLQVQRAGKVATLPFTLRAN